MLVTSKPQPPSQFLDSSERGDGQISSKSPNFSGWRCSGIGSQRASLRHPRYLATSTHLTVAAALHGRSSLCRFSRAYRAMFPKTKVSSDHRELLPAGSLRYLRLLRILLSKSHNSPRHFVRRL